MKSAHLFALCFTALTALPVIACSAADESTSTGTEDSSETLDPDGKADGSSKPLYTTYEMQTPASTMGHGQLALLVLKTDNTVHGQYAPACTTCKMASFDGDYKFTKSTTSNKKYIRITLPNDDVVRYEYKLPSLGTLKLRQVGESQWFTMAESADKWCKSASDCDNQAIIHPMCVGGFVCEDQSCSYKCGITPVNECAAAGGSCVALAPGSCADGIVNGDLSCGGGLGVECCMPKPECDKTECGPALGMPNTLCPDGVNYSGPTGRCLQNADGTCGWEVKSCPPAPADCRTTGCDSGKYCTFCWSKYACIPEGAVC